MEWFFSSAAAGHSSVPPLAAGHSFRVTLVVPRLPNMPRNYATPVRWSTVSTPSMLGVCVFIAAAFSQSSETIYFAAPRVVIYAPSCGAFHAGPREH